MPLVVKDRVKETTTTAGTGTITLAGAVSGFQSFSVIGDGNTTYYAIVGGTQWEVGIGTYTASGTTLSRDTVLESSTGGTKVNFAAGTKNVFCTYPAERSVDIDTAQSLTNKSIDASTIGGTTPAAGTFTTLTGNSTSQFGRSSANYFQAIGAAANVTPEIAVLGSDTNIPFTIESKGTGAINLSAGSRGINISNGGTVTAITRTATGDNYTSAPTVAISAPTTAGGVQATATCTIRTAAAAVAGGGTGYTLNDTLTVSGGTGTTATTLLVTGVSGGVITSVSVGTNGVYTVAPTNPVSVTGGTGSGATFNLSSWGINTTFTITNAGSGYVEQPTVTFSGGGGSGAVATATVGSTPTIRSLHSQFVFATPNGTAFQLGQYGSGSVNSYITFGTSAFSPAILEARGSDTNVSAVVSSKGTGSVQFFTNTFSQGTGVEQLRIAHTASAVNYVQVTGAATGGTAAISTQGSDANISLSVSSKGSGIVFISGGSSATSSTVRMSPSGGNALWASANNTAVNYIVVSGQATGFSPQILARGTDANVGINFGAFNDGNLDFFASGDPNAGTGKRQLRIIPVTNAVNYLQIAGSATTAAPVLSAQGSDTNIPMLLQTKGTGAIDLAAGSSGINISNGNTVTALTLTASGSGYTSLPSVAITAPTTAGGVQATATANALLIPASANVTITNGGTGYTAGDVLTISGGTASIAATLTVSTVSGGVITAISVSNNGTYTVPPANPASVTGGTGSGATFTLSFGVRSGNFTITNAGSGYVEQPTVTFSGGGGSGAAAYATVGSATTIRSLHTTMSFFTPGGEQLRVFDKANSVNYLRAQGNSTGASPSLFAFGTDAAINLNLVSYGTGAVDFFTNHDSFVRQMRVTHTASAVNYVQVTGGSTGNNAILSTQGSDSNVGLTMQTKGVGTFVFFTGGGRQFDVNNVASAVNRMTVVGSATGTAPTLSVAGNDTNIDLNLTTKGTGSVKLNTGGGEQLRVTDTATANIYVAVSGGVGGTSRATIATAGNTTATSFQMANHTAAPVIFLTNNTAEQLRIAHTASAVNYVQVTGGVTAGPAVVAAAGSDANVTLAFQPKGTGVVALYGSDSLTQLRAASSSATSGNTFLEVQRSNGFVNLLAASGVTDGDIQLTPKGTGKVVITNGLQGGTF